jgi:hypothetical protein
VKLDEFFVKSFVGALLLSPQRIAGAAQVALALKKAVAAQVAEEEIENEHLPGY